MDAYTKLNIDQVRDLAPDYGMAAMGQARFARDALGAERIGVAHYEMAPNQRVGFGHRHDESEEIYYVVGGAGRFRVGEDVFDVAPRDIVHCRPDAMREWESGPDGMEMLAFGAHVEGEESEMAREFWPR